MRLLRRATFEEKAERREAAEKEAADLAARKKALTEFRRVRDEALGTNSRTKWPACLSCGASDGWYAVGKPRHVRAPTFSRWWTGGSSTIVTTRYACIHCEARADLVRETKGFYFLHN